MACVIRRPDGQAIDAGARDLGTRVQAATMIGASRLARARRQAL